MFLCFEKSMVQSGEERPFPERPKGGMDMSIAEKLNSPALYGICGAIAIGFAFLEYKKAGKKKEENKT